MPANSAWAPKKSPMPTVSASKVFAVILAVLVTSCSLLP